MVTSRYIVNREAVAKIKKYFQIWHGMLHFANREDFMYVAELIEKYTNNDNDEYFFNAFDEVTQFHSLRKYINSCERKLELSDNLTDVNDPDNFFVQGDTLRTLLNVNLEIRLGNSIFKIINNKYSIEILDASLRTLDIARHNVNAVLNQDNVILFDSSIDADKSDKQADYSTSNLKIPIVIDNSKLLVGSTTNKLPIEIESDSSVPKTGDLCTVKAYYTFRRDGLKFEITCFSINAVLPIEYKLEIIDASTNSIINTYNSGVTRDRSYVVNHDFLKEGKYLICLTVTDSQLKVVNGQVEGLCSHKYCGNGVINVTKLFSNPGSSFPVPNPPDNCCKLFAFTKKEKIYNSSYKMVYNISVVNSAISFSISATTISYKKNNKGKWKRSKSKELITSFFGNYYYGFLTSKCNNPREISNSKYKYNDSKNSVSKIKWPYGKVSYNSIRSNHILKNENNFSVDDYLLVSKC